MHVLVGLLEDKLFDLGEKYARDFNKLLYGNGVADPKALAGLNLLVAADPSVGVVGGLDRATAGIRLVAQPGAHRGLRRQGHRHAGAGRAWRRRRHLQPGQWRRAAAGAAVGEAAAGRYRRQARPVRRRLATSSARWNWRCAPTAPTP